MPELPATIRPARPNDGPRLQAIEVAAGAQFAAVGHPEVADDPPKPVEVLATYATAGRSWVAEVPTREVVGYVLLDVLDGEGHITQVTVHPDRQGQGIGKALIEQAKTWARGNGLDAITLATFSEVPWNRPLYEHLGFRVIGEKESGQSCGLDNGKRFAHCCTSESPEDQLAGSERSRDPSPHRAAGGADDGVLGNHLRRHGPRPRLASNAIHPAIAFSYGSQVADGGRCRR